MSKPIYWAIGAGLAFAVAWVVVQKNEPPSAGTAADAIAAGHSVTLANSHTGDLAAADESKPSDPDTPTVPNELANNARESPQTPTADSALPIDVTPGFELLNTKTSSLKDTDPMKPLLLRHEELQDQPRDPGWSERMESALRKGIQDSLTARGFDTQRVELPVVECRATGCEIQAIGFREDNGKQGVDVQTIVPVLLMGPLGSELDNPHGFMSSLPDGRISFIVLLARRGT